MKVIDVHTHYSKPGKWSQWVVEWWKKMNPGDYETVVNYSPETFLKYMDEAEVEYAVVLAELSPMSVGNVTSEEVIEFCKASERLIPFANINIHISPYPYREFKKLVSMGARGLKIHPVHQCFSPLDRRLYPLYAFCEENDIPVMIHTGSSIFPGTKIKYGDPKFVDEIASDFPDLIIIMAHGGRGFWYKDAVFVVRIRKNVFIDISGLPIKRLLDYFPEMERLKDKFMFGTDWPGVPIKRSVEELMSLPISNSAKEAILYKNAKEVLLTRIIKKF